MNIPPVKKELTKIFCPFTHFLPVLGRPLAAEPGRRAAPVDLPPLAPAERGEGVPLLGEAPLLLIFDACTQTTTCNYVTLKPVLCAVLAVHHSVYTPNNIPHLCWDKPTAFAPDQNGSRA